MKFDTSNVVATPGVTEITEPGELLGLLHRHLEGDWGDSYPEDVELNEEALKDGSRLMSVFQTKNGTKIWVITDAASGDNPLQRDVTTFLLPSEY